MVRASGTQEERRSRTIRPADAQMFVLVAARVETDHGLGEVPRASAFTCSTNGEPRNVINQTSQSLPPFALLAVSKTLMTDTTRVW